MEKFTHELNFAMALLLALSLLSDLFLADLADSTLDLTLKYLF